MSFQILYKHQQLVDKDSHFMVNALFLASNIKRCAVVYERLKHCEFNSFVIQYPSRIRFKMRRRETEDQTATRKRLNKKKSKKTQEQQELPTHEEARIMAIRKASDTAMVPETKMEHRELGVDSDEEYEITDLKRDSTNKDRMSEVLNQLLLKNKISVKNAFDVPLISLDALSEFQRTSTGEGAWKKLSSTLDADTRIFGYRVDSVHADTCKVLSGLNRGEKEEVREEMAKAAKPTLEQRFLNLENLSEALHSNVGQGTLESSNQNINVQNFQYQFDVNPFFERTKRRFDQGGIRGLLMNSLELDSSMRWMIDTSTSTKVTLSDKVNFENNFSYGGLLHTDQPFQIFKHTQQIKNEIQDYTYNALKLNFLEKQTDLTPHERTPGKKISKQEQNQQQPIREEPVSSFGYGQPMDIEDRHQRSEGKNVINPEKEDAHEMLDRKDRLAHIQTKAKKIGKGMQSYTDFEKDAEKWMSEEDKKMTKMNININMKQDKDPNKLPKSVSRAFDNYILFDHKTRQTRLQIIQPLNSHKIDMAIEEEFEDYNRLPMNPPNTIDFNRPLSLKDMPEEQMVRVEEQFHCETIEEVKVSQNKKSQASIREIKQDLKQVLSTFKSAAPSFINSFHSLRQKKQSDTSDVSIQTCFVTFLHLANENNLTFKNLGIDDFVITR